MSTPRRLFALALGQRLPRTTGVETVAGLARPVTIRRDGWHVPHITAEDVTDAYYGIGFVQGQDRAFQIETYKRVASGTLSELIGSDGLRIDRLTRRLGLRRHALRQLEDLRPDLRQRVAAFARGVTDGAGTIGSPRPAHEFTLLRSEPTAHTAVDVIATLKLQAFLLAGNWQEELARLRVLAADGEEALRALDPGLPAHLPATSPVGYAVGAIVDRLAEDLALVSEHVAVGGASNNWAVAASRTATGRPLVANDPHLPPNLPPPWYLVHVTTPAWSLAGAAFAGTPGVAAGHNGHGAWGVTAGLTDDTDLFIEELAGDGRSLRAPEGEDPTPCTVRREVIAVKGADPIVEEVLEGPRGPLLGDAVATPGAYQVALKGVWLDDGPVEGLLDVATATDFDTFRSRFARWPGLTLNVVWGDVSGTIGWQLVGELPVRRVGSGAVPLPGWLPDVGWAPTRVPFASMPHLRDPDLGFVATANNAPMAGGGPFLGSDFLDGYRAAAIVDALHERDDWDVAATLRLQLDTRSLPWLELRDRVLAVDPGDDRDAARALQLLGAWDGRVSADSPAASVYELAVSDLARRIVHARAPRAGEALLGGSPLALLPHGILGLKRTAHLVELVRERPDGWFAEGWDAVLAAVLGDAVRRLREERGDDARDWAWGEVRPLVLHHVVGRASPALAAIFDRGPFPIGGDATTIPQASVSPLAPTAPPVAIASLRMAVDVGAWSNSRWVLPGGQSGNPVSPHYDDQLDLWRRGEAIAIPWTEEEVGDATVATLRLLPAAGARSADA